MPLMVSPRFTREKLRSDAIEDRIDVYEDRVAGWLLKPARVLFQTPDSGFAVLHLLLGYFEGWAQFRYGQRSGRRSKEFFRLGFLDVFHRFASPIGETSRDEIIDLLYEEARCGAFHDGFARRGIFIGNLNHPIVVTGNQRTGELGSIIINVQIFLAEVESQFRRYIVALRDPTSSELRENFIKAWEQIHDRTRPFYLPPKFVEDEIRETHRQPGAVSVLCCSDTIVLMAPPDRVKALAQLARVFSEIQTGLSLCAKTDLRTAALILLYSGIDIAGWIAANGATKTVQETFTEWVEDYVRPEKTLGCTALDLHGARCGVVHTFAPGSTLHQKGKVRKVIYAWLPSRVEELLEMTELGHLSAEYVAIQGDLLIEAFSAGVKKFLNDLNRLPTAQLQTIADSIFNLMSTQQGETLLQLGRTLSSEVAVTPPSPNPVPPEWKAPEDDPVLAWNLRDTEPDLHDRFKGCATVTAELLFVISDDRREPPHEMPAMVTFRATESEENFWGNFHAAVREARCGLAEAGHIDLNQDEENCPPIIVRMSA